MFRTSSQLCTAVLVLLSSTVAQGFHVVDNVWSVTDMQQLEQNSVCGELQRTFYPVNANLLEQLQLPAPPSSTESVQVQARSIEHTTRPHQDRHWDSGKVVDSDDTVAFVFLNTNPDARFVYGGEQQPQEEVPVKAGTMVQFAGHVPHHTRVHSGSVQLAGPFDLTTLQPVGDETIDPPFELPRDLVLNLTIGLFALIGVIVLGGIAVFL